MTVELDHLDVEGKREFVISMVIIGLFLSHATFAGRIWAKISYSGKLHAEDWFMAAALLMTYSFAVCEFYGLAHGLGKHQTQVSKADLVKMNISIWVIQRFQPPAIFCIKTSIILLYVRIFSTPTFKKVAWGIWIYTLLWTVGAWIASTFECTPVSFFWDKSIKGGHCVKNALTVIGFTNGLLSFIGDLFILCMPLPMVWRLQMNRQSRLALSGIFLFGVFVVGTSIIRLIALFGIVTTDLTFTQVEAGVWTFLEISIGITCGNLPLLRPLFKRFLGNTRSGGSKSNTHSNLQYGRSVTRSRAPAGSTVSGHRNEGFQRMDYDAESLGESGSEVELSNRKYLGEGIEVKTDVEIRMHDLGMVQRDGSGLEGLQGLGGNKAPMLTSVSALRA